MIDEKKLNRDDLCDICRSADCANCFSDKDFEKWIDMQPKLNAWIPVSERLPKNISTVIVQVKELEKPTFGWYGSINGWRLSDKDYKDLTGFSVIAWMPLPEPYKEENDDI